MNISGDVACQSRDQISIQIIRYLGFWVTKISTKAAASTIKMDARAAPPPSTLSMAEVDAPTSPSTPARIAWDDDRVKDKTSLEVLVDWMASGDNYARWTSGKPAKTELCREVNAQLEAQDIYHRTNRDVYSRLRHLEGSVANAVQYLNEQGLSERVKLDECSAAVKTKVLRSCPHYEALIGAVEPHLAKISTRKSPMKRTRKSDQEGDQVTENSGETDGAEITGEETAAPVKTDGRRRSERANRPSASGPLHYPTWDLDYTHGKTSMGVLLEWLTDEGNYSRWKTVMRHGDVTYRELCAEVDSLLHAQGITYRSNGSIQKKIWGLEKSMTQAKKVLSDSGLPDSLTLEQCKSPVKKKILELCPHFELLAPVMANKEEPAKTSKSKKKESHLKPKMQTKRSRAKTNDENEPPAKKSSKQVAKKPVKKQAKLPEKRLRPKKRSELEPLVNTRSKRQRVKKDVEQEIPDVIARTQPQTDMIEKENVERPVKIVKADKKVSTTLAVKKTVSSPAIALKRTSSRALGALEELELEQQRVRFEMEQERTKIELEATREKSKIEIEKSKIEMTVERALARQKLLSAGVVQAEVDCIFPQ